MDADEVIWESVLLFDAAQYRVGVTSDRGVPCVRVLSPITGELVLPVMDARWLVEWLRLESPALTTATLPCRGGVLIVQQADEVSAMIGEPATPALAWTHAIASWLSPEETANVVAYAAVEYVIRWETYIPVGRAGCVEMFNTSSPSPSSDPTDLLDAINWAASVAPYATHGCDIESAFSMAALDQHMRVPPERPIEGFDWTAGWSPGDAAV